MKEDRYQREFARKTLAFTIVLVKMIDVWHVTSSYNSLTRHKSVFNEELYIYKVVRWFAITLVDSVVTAS